MEPQPAQSSSHLPHFSHPATTETTATPTGTQENTQSTDRSVTTRKQEKRKSLIRVLVFTLFAYLFAWCWWGFLSPWLTAKAPSPVMAVALGFLIAVGMFAPALAMALTRLLTKEGWSYLRLVPHPGGFKNFAWLQAWLGTIVLVLVGAAVYFLCLPHTFTVREISANLSAGGVAPALPLLIALAAMQTVFFGPILNLVPALGEEWGWRGYLLPHLERLLPARVAVITSGIIWGVWHLPLTLMGHNYGRQTTGFPYTNIIAMVLFCVVIGIFFADLTQRTGSVLTPALAHATLNACAGIGMLFTTAHTPFLGPAPTGVFGATGFIVLAAWLLWKCPKRN